MPKWDKDAKEFTVNVNHSKGIKINLPKPIWDLLDQPDTLTFKIKNGQIILS